MSLLQKRHISQSQACPFFSRDDTWRHTLVECNLARCVWALSPPDIGHALPNVQETDAKTFLITLHDTLHKEDLLHILVTLWAIWHARRKAMHEDIYQNPLSTSGFVKSFLSELKTVERVSRSHAPWMAPSRRQGWIKPNEDHIKVNADGAVSVMGGYGSVGTIARDQNGQFLGASSMVFPGIVDPPTLEALAIREALSLANDIYATKIHVASDCKVVIDEIRSESMASYGAIIKEVQVRATDFPSCLFRHEFRVSNLEAHKVVKHAPNLGVGRHV